MASKAQGQFSIIDVNDIAPITGYISSNLQKTQMYNPDNNSYSPNWVSTNLILTPSLYVAGTTVNKITSTQVQSVTWYEGAGSTTAITSGGNYALSGAKNHILTVKANTMAGISGVDYRCKVLYKDATSGMVLTQEMSITFSRVINGGGIADLIVTTPSGNIFKNSEVASLTATAQLWRGSTIDTSSVSYQWYKMDGSVTSSQGGGVGWAKLANATGSYQGVTSSTLTIPASCVDSYATYKCLAKDTDSTSGTYNNTFVDTASFVDLSDPIVVTIFSNGGNMFKNGVGSTVLTAKVYQNGSEIDTAGKGTYTWTNYGNDGEIITTWGTNGQKTGKTLSVGDEDVSIKSTFVCDVVI